MIRSELCKRLAGRRFGRTAYRTTLALGAVLSIACRDEPTTPSSQRPQSGPSLSVATAVAGYSITALPTLGGTFGSAHGINSAGDIVGTSSVAGDAAVHATLWPADGGPPRDLGTLGGIYVNSSALAINDAGVIVGSSYATDGQQRATLWPADGGPPRDLGALGGIFTQSIALDINTSGDIVGISETPNHLSRRVTLWPANGGPPRELVGLGGSDAEAYRINASGDVVGWSRTLDSSPFATIWPAGGAPHALSGGLFGNAWGINDPGDIVGTSSLGATLWPADGGSPRALGTLDGRSIALAINATGDVVGNVVGVTESQATLWPAGGDPVALPTLGGGSSVWRIDDARRIVGSSGIPAGGSRAVVWRPASANQSPAADAGPDETVDGQSRSGTDVVLNGSGSRDPDGTIQKYEWFEGDALLGAGVAPTVTLSLGVHNVRLVVTDDDGATDDDVVIITVLGVAEQIAQVNASLETIVAENAGTPLGDRAQEALSRLQATQELLAQTPPDRQGALAGLKDAVAELEAAVKERLIGQSDGAALMRKLVTAARLLAQEAIAEAEARGGDPEKIAKAKHALAEGDAGRDAGQYKAAVAAYKQAVAKADGA